MALCNVSPSRHIQAISCVNPKFLNDVEQCLGHHCLPSLRELDLHFDSTIQQMPDLGQVTYSSSGKWHS